MGWAAHFGPWPSMPKGRARPAQPKGAGRAGPKETAHCASPSCRSTVMQILTSFFLFIFSCNLLKY